MHHSTISEEGNLYTILDCENIWGRLALEPLGTKSAQEPSSAPSFNAHITATGGFEPDRDQNIGEILSSIFGNLSPSGFDSGLAVEHEPLLSGNLTILIITTW